MISPLEARYYRQRVPLLWWAKRRSYATFMLRELSSLFVALFVVELLLLVRAVAHGAAAYQGFLNAMANPAVILVNVVALAFVLLHAVTFANLTPRAVVVRLRGRKVPPRVILAGVYFGWLVVTAFLAWLVVGQVAQPESRTTLEPFVWLLFSAGGVVAALVLPVLLVLFGVAIPLGWVEAPDHAHLLAVLRNPLTRLGLLGVCALALVHAAHRLRFTVEHAFQLRRYDPIIAAVCYGGALAGTVAAAYLVFAAL